MSVPAVVMPTALPTAVPVAKPSIVSTPDIPGERICLLIVASLPQEQHWFRPEVGPVWLTGFNHSIATSTYMVPVFF